MTVEEMLQRISSKEITEWMAFDSKEPIGYLRTDMQTAMILSLMANVNRDNDAHPEPFTPADFMIDWWKEEEEPEPDESWKANLQVAEMITIALGGQDLRKP